MKMVMNCMLSMCVCKPRFSSRRQPSLRLPGAGAVADGFPVPDIGGLYVGFASFFSPTATSFFFTCRGSTWAQVFECCDMLRWLDCSVTLLDVRCVGVLGSVFGCLQQLELGTLELHAK